MTLWTNWAGLESTTPHSAETPAGSAAIVDAVVRARESGSTVKMMGSGHSFTAISAPEGTMLRPSRMAGIVAVDREAMTVTAGAGTRLEDLNLALERLGLSLHNMGDIAEQTLAGAISTGTHGSGGVAAGLAAQVVGMELVTGTGEVLRLSARENPDVFEHARIGLGALGILTTVTFAVEPLFLLAAEERPATWSEGVGRLDELIDSHHHCDLYWFPYTDRMQIKTNDRVDADLSEARPLPGWRAWLDDELLANTVFGGINRVLRVAPAMIPVANRLSARGLSARSYTDVAHRVFTTPRRVRFREMEYALPREAAVPALTEARRLIERARWPIAFPVEIRSARPDDIPLSTAYRRETVYVAFHVHHAVDHTDYFTAVEQILIAHGGRPHWGKLHTRTAADLAETYERFSDFLALRDRLDPDRVFANTYLRHVLG